MKDYKLDDAKKVGYSSVTLAVIWVTWACRDERRSMWIRTLEADGIFRNNPITWLWSRQIRERRLLSVAHWGTCRHRM